MKAAAVGHGISERQALVEETYPVCRVLEEFQSSLAESAQDAKDHTPLRVRRAIDEIIERERADLKQELGDPLEPAVLGIAAVVAYWACG